MPATVCRRPNRRRLAREILCWTAPEYTWSERARNARDRCTVPVRRCDCWLTLVPAPRKPHVGDWPQILADYRQRRGSERINGAWLLLSRARLGSQGEQA
ncbi:hypothetical protein K466DRAFT_32621 [Polyporus arcularius HHB13444]|uniref:Uncharacterized protein n=1 Tax=Polyporus arcularius HHB13444 TaxID=1314778 RepID=A0A5C3PK67_9APHY|nr:hypothetical protein K466DRAFT_32621 [Polyporus arcularius HHB13444]